MVFDSRIGDVVREAKREVALKQHQVLVNELKQILVVRVHRLN
jgi:hypothetical protein